MTRPFSWTPSDEVIARAQLTKFLSGNGLKDYDALVAWANADPASYWNAIFEFFEVVFETPYRSVVEYPNGPELPKWCVGGTTNIVLTCIDRHRGTPTWSKPALIAVAEDGTRRVLDYAELDREVSALAELLIRHGAGEGDVVAISLPMIPEAAIAFFAILKIGAIVLPLFSGFGAQPIVDRLSHSGAKAIITADFALRRGKEIGLLSVVQDAVSSLDDDVIIFALDRGGCLAQEDGVAAWQTGGEPSAPVATAIVDAEAPAMLMYTSGTTGAPKGTIHTHCGMLAKNALDMGLCIDMGADDRLIWMSDMGWIAGPKMIFVSAMFGATLILVEGTPTWPESDRLLKIAGEESATILALVPTIVRQIMRTGGMAPGRDLSAMRCVLSAGEPWTEEAWVWFFEEVGKKRVPILNFAGGTECGGAILIGTPLHPCRPGSFGGPVPGSGTDIVNEKGEPVPAGTIGELVMRQASIGLTRGLWKAQDRFIENYWRQIPGVWVQGDLASRDEDGLWYLHGRSDDVIKIAGKRTGPAEIETAVMQTGLARDCVAIGIPDEITGSALMCVYVPMSQQDAALANSRISDAVAERCGASYRPRHMLRVEELPRTRNEKSMRRIVRSIVLGTPIGDTSSLANLQSIDSIRDAASAQLVAVNSQS